MKVRLLLILFATNVIAANNTEKSLKINPVSKVDDEIPTKYENISEEHEVIESYDSSVSDLDDSEAYNYHNWKAKADEYSYLKEDYGDSSNEKEFEDESVDYGDVGLENFDTFIGPDGKVEQFPENLKGDNFDRNSVHRRYNKCEDDCQRDCGVEEICEKTCSKICLRRLDDCKEKMCVYSCPSIVAPWVYNSCIQCIMTHCKEDMEWVRESSTDNIHSNQPEDQSGKNEDILQFSEKNSSNLFPPDNFDGSFDESNDDNLHDKDEKEDADSDDDKNNFVGEEKEADDEYDL